MTIAQNKTVHALLHSTGLMAQKANIIGGISFGRTESSKDLTDEEVNHLIEYLKAQEKDNTAAQRMRRKIISMAHQLHWHLPGTQKIDMEHVNSWCTQYGYGHKKLNDYTYPELPKLVTQFKNVFSGILSNL